MYTHICAFPRSKHAYKLASWFKLKVKFLDFIWQLFFRFKTFELICEFLNSFPSCWQMGAAVLPVGDGNWRMRTHTPMGISLSVQPWWQRSVHPFSLPPSWLKISAICPPKSLHFFLCVLKYASGKIPLELVFKVHRMHRIINANVCRAESWHPNFSSNCHVNAYNFCTYVVAFCWL